MEQFLRLSWRVTVILLLLGLLSGMAISQTSRGTVNGLITDSTGAVIPNAQVILTQKGTNVTRETQSNEAGIYRFDAVNLGTYSIAVTAAGFAKATTDRPADSFTDGLACDSA